MMQLSLLNENIRDFRDHQNFNLVFVCLFFPIKYLWDFGAGSKDLKQKSIDAIKQFLNRFKIEDYCNLI
jgi:hypothetical protein